MALASSNNDTYYVNIKYVQVAQVFSFSEIITSLLEQ